MDSNLSYGARKRSCVEQFELLSGKDGRREVAAEQGQVSSGEIPSPDFLRFQIFVFTFPCFLKGNFPKNFQEPDVESCGFTEGKRYAVRACFKLVWLRANHTITTLVF